MYKRKAPPGLGNAPSAWCYLCRAPHSGRDCPRPYTGPVPKDVKRTQEADHA